MLRRGRTVIAPDSPSRRRFAGAYYLHVPRTRCGAQERVYVNALLQARRRSGIVPDADYAKVQLSRLALGGDQLAVDQTLGDLNGIERRAFAQIVRDNPHRQPVLDRGVVTNAADIGGVLADRLIWRHVAAGLARIDHQATRRIAQRFARLIG